MKSLAVLNECLFSSTQKEYLKKRFADVVFYNDTKTEEDAIKRVGKRNIIIMDQFHLSFSENFFQNCTNVELIILNTTAYDGIEIELLKKHDVKLANLRDYATQDVAEVILSMTFELNNRTEIGQKIVKGEEIGFPSYKHVEKVNDIWPDHPILPYIKRRQLLSQTVGIVGLGNIGKRCAEMFSALGIHVIGFNRSRKYIPGVEIVPLRKLFQKADIIILAMAYNRAENHLIINKELLDMAKADALLVSAVHPNLIDIEYLIANPSKFRGIGLDYQVSDAVRELFKARKNTLIVTPHLGSQSVEAIENMTEGMIEAAISFADGKPLYLVN